LGTREIREGRGRRAPTDCRAPGVLTVRWVLREVLEERPRRGLLEPLALREPLDRWDSTDPRDWQDLAETLVPKDPWVPAAP